MGIVGYSPEGPTDEATLVTSWEDYTNKFGPLTQDSRMPLSMAAFFSNGGRRAYVVRVVPDDATLAECKIQSQTTDQTLETGDGIIVLFTKTAATTLLKVNSGASPIVPSSLTIRWRETAVPVLAQPCMQRDGTTPLVGDGATLLIEGILDPAVLPAIDQALDKVEPGTVIINWLSGAAPKTLALSTVVGSICTGTNGAGSAGIIDCRSGRFSLDINVAELPDVPPPANPFTADYTPCTANKTCTDDGLGVLAGDLAAPGVVSYTDGSYTFTTVAAPYDGCPMLCTYEINAWDLDPISEGSWGNDLRIRVKGNLDYYTGATGQYTRFNVDVMKYSSSLGDYEIKEPYEELDFSDPTSTKYFADVLNDLSDLVNVTQPAGDEPPGQLLGIPRTLVVAGGDETAPSQTIQTTLGHAPVVPRTFSLTWTSAADGTTKTITDDGAGNLIGDIDAAGVNTIVYATGAIDVALVAAHVVDANSLVTVTYYTGPEETQHDEDFGDTAKGYTQGVDGTFDATHFGRARFTSPTLIPLYRGLYALNRVEELLQVIIPDFAGDTVVTGDILDYCDGRESLPSGGDRFAILTVPYGSSAQEAVDWFKYTLARFSKWAALYWPWVTVADPLSDNRDLAMPVLGHVAGIYARTDNDKNVGKAPGGTIDGQLRFITGLEMNPDIEERNLVYPNRINPLISSPATGRAVWGVRTISNDSDWRYINVRRLFMYAERSVYNSTHWIVFENNGPALWARIKAQLDSFLNTLFTEGMLAGTSPAEAFQVVVDSTNNTAATIEAGQVIIDVALAPNKPAEFVRFRFTQMALAT
jgi:hypothetical protein